MATPRKRKPSVVPTVAADDDPYTRVVAAYRDLWKQILVGVSTPKDRADLDAARARAEAIKESYPTLWEKACLEVKS